MRLRQVDHRVRRSRPSWPRWWNPVSTKNTKIIWAWWRMPVVPATWEAEAGNHLNPRGRCCRWTCSLMCSISIFYLILLYLFLRPGLALSPRLECSGVVSTHCILSPPPGLRWSSYLSLPSSCDHRRASPHQANLAFLKIGLFLRQSHSVVQAGVQ